jgi:hypothetical protein
MQIGANASWSGRHRPTWEQGAEIRTVSSADAADEIQVLGVLADASQSHPRVSNPTPRIACLVSTAPRFDRATNSGWT